MVAQQVSAPSSRTPPDEGTGLGFRCPNVGLPRLLLTRRWSFSSQADWDLIAVYFGNRTDWDCAEVGHRPGWQACPASG